MIDYDSSIMMEIHKANVRQMVSYCENIHDCRRSIQLNYFAENFPREKCLANRDTCCDNCSNDDVSVENVTKISMDVVETVKILHSKNTQMTVPKLAKFLVGKKISDVLHTGMKNDELLKRN